MKCLPKYRGKPISYGPRSKLVTRAYNCWATQRKRCTNPKSKDYKNYGGKGIQVEYESLEFVLWYIKTIKLKRYKWATVGRVDHSKNYSFSNIEMQEMTVNVKERVWRNPQGIIIEVFQNGKKIKTCRSKREVEALTGINGNFIDRYIKTKGKSHKWGYSFKYGETSGNRI